MRTKLLAAVAAAVVVPLIHGQTWVSTGTKAFTPVLGNAQVTGPLPATTPLHIVVGLKQRNADQIQPMLKQMITPGTPLYGHSLTVDGYVQQFAPTAAQVSAVSDYLANYGFANIVVAPNRLLIEADANAAQVEAAFNTGLVTVSQAGQTFFANATDAQVPASLSGTVLAVLGLNNIKGLHTNLVKYPAKATVPCTPPACPVPDPANEVYGAQQYQIAYNAASPGSSPTATNLSQKVATGSQTAIGIIVEGNIGTVSSSAPYGPDYPSDASTGVIHDLYLYETLYQLPPVPVTITHAGIPSPDVSGADEWDLDTQTSTGIAQQVQALYLYVATSLTDSDIGLAINKAVSDNKVKAFNMSFGECEVYPYTDGAMALDDEEFAEAALQGITAFASSDDNGSACPAGPTNGVPGSGPPMVSYPAASPYVIAVGGTNLFTNADFTYDYETAWEASGGGISAFETAPFWQTYTGSGTAAIVPSATGGMRGLPDVAMCAGGTGLAICSANIYVGGTTSLVGGTSLSSPLSVGSWARIQSSHNNQLGFAAPLIYQLANGAPTLSSPYFNDVTAGSNGFYSALPGYDYTTGLGTWDIYTINQNIPLTYPH